MLVYDAGCDGINSWHDQDFFRARSVALALARLRARALRARARAHQGFLLAVAIIRTRRALGRCARCGFPRARRRARLRPRLCERPLALLLDVLPPCGHETCQGPQ